MRDYEVRINALIPLALEIADKAQRIEAFEPTEDGRIRWGEAWNKEYHAAMDRLAFEHGLRDFSWRPKNREWRNHVRWSR